MGNPVPIYQTGNSWQKKVYAHMASFLQKKGVTSFGLSANGNRYRHLLSEAQSELNFVTKGIYTATLERFNTHKAGDLNRILTNTAASQPYCFNLIIYLQQHLDIASRLFSILLDKPVDVKHLEPEFTPNHCDHIGGFERSLPEEDESIGDQNGKQGTDADIAVFYKYENDKKGLLLIEFKFIEAEFSVCSSYKNKERIRAVCNSPSCFAELVEQKQRDSKGFLCGYNKFLNWQLTKESSAFDSNEIKSLAACPFRFGLNQLWRNMILAEKVAKVRQCDEFGFWVFSPKQNDCYLWNGDNIESEFRAILTEQGFWQFKKIHLETVLVNLRGIVLDAGGVQWLSELETKYNIK